MNLTKPINCISQHTLSKTWVIDLRCDDGAITLDYVKDENGNEIQGYTSQRIGDAYIIAHTQKYKGTSKITINE